MVKSIINIVNQEYNDHNFNVSALIEKCNYCSDTIRDRLNIELDITPSKLIENIRIEKALHLLFEDNKINEVYKNCGFATARAFRFAFKRRTELSPTQFKMIVKTEDQLIQLKSALWDNNEAEREF